MRSLTFCHDVGMVGDGSVEEVTELFPSLFLRNGHDGDASSGRLIQSESVKVTPHQLMPLSELQ